MLRFKKIIREYQQQQTFYNVQISVDANNNKNNLLRLRLHFTPAYTQMLQHIFLLENLAFNVVSGPDNKLKQAGTFDKV